jgi:hypothetical protein
MKPLWNPEISTISFSNKFASSITQYAANLSANSCHITRSWQKTQVSEMSECFCYLLQTSLKQNSGTMLKITWYDDRSPLSDHFQRKFLFGILILSKQWLSFPWTKCNDSVCCHLDQRKWATYSFFPMTLIQTRRRNCPHLETDLILAVSTGTPRIDKLVSSKQAHVCHRRGKRKRLGRSPVINYFNTIRATTSFQMRTLFRIIIIIIIITTTYTPRLRNTSRKVRIKSDFAHHNLIYIYNQMYLEIQRWWWWW